MLTGKAGIVVPSFQMGKQKGAGLPQGPTAGKWQSWDLDPWDHSFHLQKQVLNCVSCFLFQEVPSSPPHWPSYLCVSQLAEHTPLEAHVMLCLLPWDKIWSDSVSQASCMTLAQSQTL